MTATAPLIIHYSLLKTLIIHYSKKYLLQQDIKKEPRTLLSRSRFWYTYAVTRKLTVNPRAFPLSLQHIKFTRFDLY